MRILPLERVNKLIARIRAYSPDLGWAVVFGQGSTPSGIMTDFPNSMELSYFILQA